MTARLKLCETCDGFGWNYDRLGARVTCPDCSGQNVRREAPTPDPRDVVIQRVTDLAHDLDGITGARWIADALHSILEVKCSKGSAHEGH